MADRGESLAEPNLPRARGKFIVFRVTAICALAAFADGYDVQALGLSIPRMAADFGLKPADFAIAASTSLIGMAIGAMFLSPLADRLGRARMVVLMLLLIGVTTLGTALANDPITLAVWRFGSGLGLGAVVPVAIALTSLTAPSRIRAALVTVMVSFTGVGAFFAGIAAPMLDAHWGWRGIFGFGAVMPLAIAGLAIFVLPMASPEDRPVQPGGLRSADGIAGLFSPSLRRLSLLVWTVFWFNLMVNYSLISWLPSLLSQAGWPMAAASRATGLVAIGGIVGALAIAVCADRGWAVPTLIMTYLTAAAILAMFWLMPPAQTLWMLLLCCVGLTAFGAQIALSAIVAVRYPVAIRSTAIGGASGFGRIGAFIGPLVMAGLMSGGATPAAILAMLIMPMIVCALCIWALPKTAASFSSKCPP